MENENIAYYNEENLKKKHLILSLFFDLVGMMSYLIPFSGEIIDLFWAPIAGILLMKMYNGILGKVAGIIGFIEEFIPFLDFIPTFTIAWFYNYNVKGKGTHK
jgi:hypothetical protein